MHDAESYPAILTNEFQVTNASHLGFYDVTVISYGINDVDLNRFYFQSALKDTEELRNGKSGIKVQHQKLFYQSSLLIIMHKMIFSTMAQFTSAETTQTDYERYCP